MSSKFTVPVKDSDLLHAIELRCSECFPAMNIANALGGSRTVPWDLVRTYSLVEMLQEAKDRGLDLSNLKAAVDGRKVVESKAYAMASSKGGAA